MKDWPWIAELILEVMLVVEEGETSQVGLYTANP